jgi:aminopeptidase N
MSNFTNVNYFTRARYWLACVDFPTVRTTLAWHITAPERFTSLANGAFIEEDVKDGFKTTHWKLDHRW